MNEFRHTHIDHAREAERFRREYRYLWLGWCFLVSLGATVGAAWGWATRERA